jgi:hypothetical protein
MAPFIVNVSGIAPSTTETQLHDFFTFCGQISSIQRDKGTAAIAFEKSSAAKTALMLDGGNLDGSSLSVKSDVVHQDDHKPPLPHEHHIEQSDKPRAGIAAEYLARGYTLSDHILTRAIEIDNTQGISKRFLSYFQHLDKTAGHHTIGPGQTISGQLQAGMNAATQHAKGLETQGYYAKAMQSPLGLQVRNFYTTTSKKVRDIHEEARRISSQHKEKAAKNAAKNSQPVELKANTAVSENPEPATDAAKASGPTESKADTAVSGNSSTAPDAA